MRGRGHGRDWGGTTAPSWTKGGAGDGNQALRPLALTSHLHGLRGGRGRVGNSPRGWAPPLAVPAPSAPALESAFLESVQVAPPRGRSWRRIGAWPQRSRGRGLHGWGAAFAGWGRDQLHRGGPGPVPCPVPSRPVPFRGAAAEPRAHVRWTEAPEKVSAQRPRHRPPRLSRPSGCQVTSLPSRVAVRARPGSSKAATTGAGRGSRLMSQQWWPQGGEGQLSRSPGPGRRPGPGRAAER